MARRTKPKEQTAFYVGNVLVVPDHADYGLPVVKPERPIPVFPSKEAKLAWLAEGARTGQTPPYPDGTTFE